MNSFVFESFGQIFKVMLPVLGPWASIAASGRRRSQKPTRRAALRHSLSPELNLRLFSSRNGFSTEI
jgi:hypothetical protein